MMTRTQARRLNTKCRLWRTKAGGELLDLEESLTGLHVGDDILMIFRHAPELHSPGPVNVPVLDGT